MLSTTLSAALARRGLHYGWVVVAATFLTMLVMAGAVGAPGVLILPLQREFGWDTADISAALAVRFALFGLMAPFAAAFLNRYGLRRVALVAVSVVATGLLLSLGMSRLWQLVLLWGVVVGLGTGLTALVLGATVAARWFTERRGLVVGLLTASTATGQLVFMPLLAALTEALGWRAALGFVVSLLALAAAAIALFLRDRPADLGLPPYGERDVQAVPAAPTTGPIAGAAFGALRMAARTPIFWVLFLTFFICGASTNGLVQVHFVPLCADFGIAPVGAAGVLATIGLFDLVGTVASGWLSDRFDNRWLLFWYYGLRGLSLVFLPFSDFSLYGLSLFAVFYGLDWVATVPPTVRLTAETFGRERANLVFGWIFAGHQLGAAMAAFGAGWSRGVHASYLPAFFVAGALCLIAAALILASRGRGGPGLAGAAPRAA